MLTYFAQQAPCLVGMEACGGAHYWARKLQAQGHTARLMAPQFVKPYVKANKTDAADAEAMLLSVYRRSLNRTGLLQVHQTRNSDHIELRVSDVSAA